MPLKTSRKISAVILGIAVMAVINSAVAVFALVRIKSIMDAAVYDDLAAVHAADQVNLALVRQNALLRSYVLDSGNEEWLSRVGLNKKRFDQWLAEVRRCATTAKEKEILKELEALYRVYSEKRDNVLAVFRKGDTARARELAVQDLTPLYMSVNKCCEDLAAVNQELADAEIERARKHRDWATWIVILAATVTLGLTAGLVALFFRDIFSPLRRMLEEVRGFSRPLPADDVGEDELRQVGRHLRTLMTDAAASRSAVEQEHAQRLASVGRLATRVSHEIRRPLASIRHKIKSLQEAAGKSPATPHDLEDIEADTERLERSVRQFLEFSGPPLLRLRPQPICPVLEKTVEFFRQRLPEHGVELTYECQTRLPFVASDPQQLEQVFVNLLSNALESSPDQVRICVTAQLETDDDGRQMVVARVTDNGPGIAPEMRERIFEPFFTTKREGTGLGLCLAAQIVVGHGGSLVLESTGPQGTTFAVRLPVSSQWFPS